MADKKVQYESIDFSDEEEAAAAAAEVENLKPDPDGLLTLETINNICGEINYAEENEYASGGGEGGLAFDLNPSKDLENPEAQQITIDTASYMCKLCMKSYDEQFVMEAHLIADHDLGEQTALFTCLKTVRKKKRVWRREKDGYFHCIHCHHRSRRSINVRQHEKSQHDGMELPLKNYVCKLCKKKFAIEQIFVHIQDEHPDQADNAGFVGNNLAEHYTVDIQTLTKSIKLSDSQDQIEAPLDGTAALSKKTPFSYCQHCSFKTKSERGLRLHERMQHASANIKKGKAVCKVCGAARTKNAIHVCTKVDQQKRGRKNSLIRDSEGRYLCADCDYKSKTYSGIHTHTKARKHQIQRTNPVVYRKEVSKMSEEELNSPRKTRSSGKKGSKNNEDEPTEKRSGEFIIEKDIASSAMIGLDNGAEEREGTVQEEEEEEEEETNNSSAQAIEELKGVNNSINSFFDTDSEEEAVAEDSDDDDDWTPSGVVKHKSRDDSDSEGSFEGRRKRKRSLSGDGTPKKKKYPKDPNSPAPKKTESGDYQCNFCPFESKYQQSIETHQWRHTGFKPFRCDTCGNNFRSKQRVDLHKCFQWKQDWTPGLPESAVKDQGNGPLNKPDRLNQDGSAPPQVSGKNEPHDELDEMRTSENVDVNRNSAIPESGVPKNPSNDKPHAEGPPPETQPPDPNRSPQMSESNTAPADEDNQINIAPTTVESNSSANKAPNDKAQGDPPSTTQEKNPPVTSVSTTLEPATPIVIEPPLSTESMTQGDTSPNDCVVTSFTEGRARNRMPLTNSSVPVNISPMLGGFPGMPGQRPFMPPMGHSEVLQRMAMGQDGRGMMEAGPPMMMPNAPQHMHPMGTPLEAMSMSLTQMNMNVAASMRPQTIQIEPLATVPEPSSGTSMLCNTSSDHLPDIPHRDSTPVFNVEPVTSASDQSGNSKNAFSTAESALARPSPLTESSTVSDPRVTDALSCSPVMTSSPLRPSGALSGSPASTIATWDTSQETSPHRRESEPGFSPQFPAISSPHPSIDSSMSQEPTSQAGATLTSITDSAPPSVQSSVTESGSVPSSTPEPSQVLGGGAVLLTGVTAISDVTPTSGDGGPTPVLLTPNLAAMASQPMTTPSTTNSSAPADANTVTSTPAPSAAANGKTINDLHKCILCRVYFEDQAMHRNHMAHHGQQIGTCRVCNQMFRTPLAFMNHLHCSFQCRGLPQMYSSRGRGARGSPRQAAPQHTSPGTVSVRSRGPRAVSQAANISLAQAMSSGLSNSPGQHRISPMTAGPRVTSPVAALASMSPRSATSGRRGRPPLTSYRPRAQMPVHPQMQLQHRQQLQQRQQQQHMMHRPMPPQPPAQRRRPAEKSSDVIVID